jgi:hypothetical protein
MSARGATKLLQLIIRTGELGHARAVQQAWPGAATDLHKVPDRGREGAGFGLLPSHRPQQPLPPPLPGGLRELALVVEARCDTLHPVIGRPHSGPQQRGRVQPTLQDGLQAPSRLGEGPLCSTRSRLWVMVLSRSWRGSPAATRGGWPASVRALRTARQEPRMTSASGAVRPSIRRSRGRTPRTCFVRVFLAWRSAA